MMIQRDPAKKGVIKWTAAKCPEMKAVAVEWKSINLILFLVLAAPLTSRGGELEAIASYQAKMEQAKADYNRDLPVKPSVFEGFPLASILRGGSLAYSARHTLQSDNPYSALTLIGAGSSLIQSNDVHSTVSGIMGF